MLKTLKSEAYGVLALTLLATLYLTALPRSLPDFDAGEFLTIASKGGIAHPPGYPFYLLLLRLVALTLSTDVQVLAGFSGLCVLLGALFIYGSLRVAALSAPAAALGIAVAFSTAPVIRVATGIEPFGLNLLLASILLAISLLLYRRVPPSSPLPASTTAALIFAAGVTLGCGFGNHHSLVLLVPLTLVSIWRGNGGPCTKLAIFAVGAVIGLQSLWYFAWGSSGAYIYGDWSQGLRSLSAVLLRQSYGTLQLASHATGQWYTAPLVFLAGAPGYLSFVFVILPLAVGLSPKTAKAKIPLILVAGSFVLSSVVFATLFHLGKRPIEVMLVERFFALPMVLLAPLLAVGSESLWGKWQKRWLLRTLAPVFLGLHLLTQWDHSERRSESFSAAHVHNILKTAGADAVIICVSDMEFMGLSYVTLGQGLYPGTTVVALPLLGNAWYRRQFLHLAAPNSGDSFDVTLYLADLIERRPVFVLHPESPVLDDFLAHSYPLGPLVRLLPKAQEPPEVLALFHENLALAHSRLELPGPGQVAAMKAWEVRLLSPYARTWSTLSASLARAGASREAAAAGLLAGELAASAASPD